MDLHVPAPSSSDGLYDLVEPAPPVVPPSAAPAGAVVPPTEPRPEPTPDVPKTRRGLGSLWKRESAGAKDEVNGKAAAAAPEAGASPEAKDKAGVGTEPASAPAPQPKKKKRRRRRRFDAPSWAVSLLVHVVVLTALGLATFHGEVRKAVANINSALVSSKGAEDEVLHVLAEPAAERSDQAVGNEADTSAAAALGGGEGFSGIGSGPPSATPRVRGASKGLGDGSNLPGVKVVAQVSGLSMIPPAARLGVDLGGGGQIRGDVTFEAKDVGAALDQLAREILRHLSQHKLTVVWMFDESTSMKDDQREIRSKFDRVASELKLNVDTTKKQTPPLTHAVVGFGKELHFDLEKPTANIDLIGRAIERLRVDDSGIENTLEAIQGVVAHYSPSIKKDRKLLIVLVTDESGDDGSHVEEAHEAVVNLKVPVYIIGRQSLFGYERAHLRYVDPVTKDVYWPTIRRGPETADVELVQWDGLHERWDEQPSGFAPYELARISQDSGGIYFLLPSEENMRVRQKEKLYSITTLKEYLPEYDNRVAYVQHRNQSEFRRTLYAIIQETRPKSPEDLGYIFRRHFPVMPEQLVPACVEAAQAASVRLEMLLKIQQRLEGMKKLRNQEPLKRWQAHYDLMLAQIVTYQIKAYEYRACLEEMAKVVPRPRAMPSPELVVEWVMDHSHDRKAPKANTEKKYLEAQRLLKKVIELHPRTPWADLAQDELDRGLGCQRSEWHHSPKYDERSKLVPHY